MVVDCFVEELCARDNGLDFVDNFYRGTWSHYIAVLRALSGKVLFLGCRCHAEKACHLDECFCKFALLMIVNVTLFNHFSLPWRLGHKLVSFLELAYAYWCYPNFLIYFSCLNIAPGAPHIRCSVVFVFYSHRVVRYIGS